MKKWISRRNFLKAAGISAVAAGLTACGGSSSSTIRFGSCQRRNAQGRYVLPSVLSPTRSGKGV